MIDLISVIIPTYNPNRQRLQQTLDGLKNQDLDKSLWELIIIDNNSDKAFADELDLDWHPSARIVRESRQGLTHARLKGFEEAKGDIVVMIDDDNVAMPDYLSNTRDIFKDDNELGAIGGKSLPVFEVPAPAWLPEFYGNLALRNLGEAVITSNWESNYPACAPLGAGMALRKAALQGYIDKIKQGKTHITDRSGSQLSSSGDNDIVIEVLKSGWSVGYFPALVIHHLIPQERVQVAYMARLINNTNKSWVQLLESHGINPWKKVPAWSVPLRKAKAWLAQQAWKNPANYIRWRGICGTFDALTK